MKKYTKILALLLAAAILISGCAAKTPATVAPGTTSPTSSDDKRTDLTIGIINEPTALDPTNSPYDIQSNARIVGNVYEGLMTTEADGTISGNVAENWDISEDGLTYTFHLLGDVKFHNGDTLTAEDVKYTFDKAITSGFAVEVTGDMQETVAVDATTFVLKLSSPNASMLQNIAQSRALYIANKAVAENLGENFTIAPIGGGSGPYKFESWVPGVSITLTANEEYRKGAPSIKTVTFKFIHEPSSGAIALETGDIDVYADLSLVDVPNLQNNAKLQVDLVQSKYVYYICLNQQKEPYNNVLVRKAIAYAINLDDLIMAVTNGIGGTKTGSLTATNCFGYLEFDPIEQDIEKAKALLAEAGYPDGITIKMVVCDGSRKKIGETLQGMLPQAGITVELDVMEMSAMAEMAVASQHETLPQVAAGYIPDADSELTDKVVSDSWGNFSRINDPHIDELMTAARKEIDPDKRIAMYHEVQQIVHDEMHIIPLYYVNTASAANADLKGFKTNPDLSYYLPSLSW